MAFERIRNLAAIGLLSGALTSGCGAGKNPEFQASLECSGNRSTLKVNFDPPVGIQPILVIVEDPTTGQEVILRARRSAKGGMEIEHRTLPPRIGDIAVKEGVPYRLSAYQTGETESTLSLTPSPTSRSGSKPTPIFNPSPGVDNSTITNPTYYGPPIPTASHPYYNEEEELTPLKPVASSKIGEITLSCNQTT